MNEEPNYDLIQFFGVYFNQDWPYDADSPVEILDRYIESHPKDRRVRLASQLETFVNTHDEESLKHALFKELGCYYAPDADGYSARSWMQEVARRLRTE